MLTCPHCTETDDTSRKDSNGLRKVSRMGSADTVKGWP